MDQSQTITITKFHFSASVRRLSSKLESKEISAWELVREMLVIHDEYGAGMGQNFKQVVYDEPSNYTKQSVDAWLASVCEQFEPWALPSEKQGHERFPLVDGRLLICGLANLETPLGRYLDNTGLLAALKNELQVDFKALLKPSYAGDEAYRGKYLLAFNNKAKYRDDESPREHGLVCLVTGAASLESLVEVSLRQTWNTRVATARYRMEANSGWLKVLQLAIEDVTNFQNIDISRHGDWRPAPESSRELWQAMIGQLPVKYEKLLKNADSMRGALAMMNNKSFLSTGDRLVILIEVRGVGGSMTLQQLGITADWLQVLLTMPDRLIVAISGLNNSQIKEVQEYANNQKSLQSPLLLNLPPDPEATKPNSCQNDMPAYEDLLGIRHEVNAIADSIMLKETKPPMVVGVLGGWGWGKSSVMQLIQRRIIDIRCQAAVEGQDEKGEIDLFPFVGHTYPIWFDAWTYAKSDLWASLMYKICSELDRMLFLEKRIHEEIVTDPKAGNNIWRVLTDIKKIDVSNETDLRILKRAIDEQPSYKIDRSLLWAELDGVRSKQREAINKRSVELDAEDSRLADIQIPFEKNKVENAVVKKVSDNLFKVIQGLTDKGNSPGLSEQDRDQFIKNVKSWKVLPELLNRMSWQTILMVIAVFFMAYGLVYGLAFLLPPLEIIYSKWVNTVVGMISATVVFLGKLTQLKDKLFEDVNSSIDKERNAFNDELKRCRDIYINYPATITIGAKDKQQPETFDELAQLWALQMIKRKKLAHKTEELSLSHRLRNLRSFLSERLGEGDDSYQDRLGLVYRVQKDLRVLSDALMDRANEETLFKRKNPRVFLFIDDLDRCPPDKVVDVLEAVQLLVKTELFVVILAIDVRYVTRCLEDKYKGVLSRQDQPSGLDYIEKIIQLPYRIRPAAADAVAHFLAQNMKVYDKQNENKEDHDGNKKEHKSVDSDQAKPDNNTSENTTTNINPSSVLPDALSPTSQISAIPYRALRFDSEEHTMLSGCCYQVGISPRAMRRQLNVFKILKIIWHRSSSEPDKEVKKIIMGILAIAARYPDVMRDLLSSLEMGYVGGHIQRDENIVKHLLKRVSCASKQGKHSELWNAVSELLTTENLIPQKLTFADLSEINLHLISSFAFVGDVDLA